MQASDARAAALRVDVNVEIIFAENNAIQQIHQLYSHIHAPEAERPAAIVVEAVSREGMKRVALNAAKAGIAWVVQQWKTDYLDAIRAECPGAAVTSVAVDEEEIGGIQARQFSALLPRGGAAFFVQGPGDSDTAVHRMAGLTRGLAGTRIELRPVLNGDWTSASGYASSEILASAQDDRGWKRPTDRGPERFDGCRGAQGDPGASAGVEAPAVHGVRRPVERGPAARCCRSTRGDDREAHLDGSRRRVHGARSSGWSLAAGDRAAREVTPDDRRARPSTSSVGACVRPASPSARGAWPGTRFRLIRLSARVGPSGGAATS